MDEGGLPPDDAREELRLLARSAAALVEQHRDAGTSGFPRRPRPAAVPRSAPLPEAQASVPAPSPAHRSAAQPPAGAGYDDEAPSYDDGPPPYDDYDDGPPIAAPPPRVVPAVRAPAAATAVPAALTLTPPVAPPRARAVALEVVPPEQRPARLALIDERVKGCVACGLATTRKNTVFARGNPASELCFVGEGPGADEDASGLPFVGKAGQLLDKMIAAMGYHVDDVYICNIVKCRPPENRKPTPEEMATCGGYVREQIAIVAPKVIVALGGTAVEGLFGSNQGGITRMRGQWKLYQAKIPVMPTFHPAYVLRQPDAKKEVWADLRAVLDKLGKKPPGRGG